MTQEALPRWQPLRVVDAERSRPWIMADLDESAFDLWDEFRRPFTQHARYFQGGKNEFHASNDVMIYLLFV